MCLYVCACAGCAFLRIGKLTLTVNCVSDFDIRHRLDPVLNIHSEEGERDFLLHLGHFQKVFSFFPLSERPNL